MPMSSSEKSKRYRESKIRTIADAQGLSFDDAKKVFNKLEADKRRARRMKQKAEVKQPEVKSQCDELQTHMTRVKQNSRNKNNRVVSFTPQTSKLNIDNVKRNYERMFNESFQCTESQLDEYQDSKRVIDYVVNRDSRLKKLTSKRKYLESIGSVLLSIPKYKTVGRRYLDEAINLQKRIEVNTDHNKLSRKELMNWTDFKIVENAYKSDKLNPQEAALLGLYTLIPPRRRSFATFLTVIDKDEKEDPDLNYLVIDGGNPILLVLNNYKTSKTYGRVEIRLPSSLKRLFRNHLQSSGLMSGNRVFQTSWGKPYQLTNLSNYLQNTFHKATGNHISFNLLRHIYITHHLSTPRSLTYKKRLSSKMGHSIGQQLKYIRITE